MADVKITALPAGTPTSTSLVPVVNGGVTQRVTVGSILGLGANGTINTTAYVYGNPTYVLGGAAYPLNSIAASANAAYPVQEYIDRLEKALTTQDIVRYGGSATLAALSVGGTSILQGSAQFRRSMLQGATWTTSTGATAPTSFTTKAPEIYFGGSGATSNLTVAGNVNITGNLKYGGVLTQGPIVRADPSDPDSEIDTLVYESSFELPTPTQQGYLRADQDPASGWYFAEPVILSDTQPPDPPGDPQLPTIWAKPVDAANLPASRGLTLAQVQAEIDAKLAALPAGETVDTAAMAAAILPDIRKTLNGGVEPPPDITTWTLCPITSFVNPKPQSSTVEVIQLNGVLYFRGSFIMPAGQPTTSAAGGFAYLELPVGFTRPKNDTRVILLGRVSPGAPAPVIGVGEVRSAVSFINVMVPGCDTIYFDNVSVRVT